MFKQLRNRFLILNLVIITVMMIISFSSIYLITYNNVQREITLELNKFSDIDRKSNDGPKAPKPDNNDIIENNTEGETHEERSIYFVLTIDMTNNITTYSSIFDMDTSFYEAAKEKALALNTSRGSFKLENADWEFMIKQTPDGTVSKMAFLNVTSRDAYLTSLIYTFSAVAIVMVIAIFFISRFFANRAIRPIKETFERQKQFIADASHELKTPLAVINTNAEALLSNDEDTIKNQSKWIFYIKSEVERMTKLTNDLLYLAQVDQSDIKLLSSDFDLSETVEEVILTMEAAIFENNLLLDYNIDPKIICRGNSSEIKQVVMILLDNALKYTNPKGKISLSLKKSSNKAIMTIYNTGKGIPEEHLKHIFDRFYRADKSRSKESGGYGLGLAIAKAIADKHGGRISVKSVVNESTTFTVEIPSAASK